ncbi:MAG: hypothetical protein JKY55_19155, partial [Aliivibrio sp.]|uniref:hypothetical protein n=1 Tax=Aliivibrio sp. TaxID=1872443 RepID=UPI001A5436A8|nr:hypothetical protein [Aliivibrio sp.]
MHKILLFITPFSSLAFANEVEEKKQETLTTDQLAIAIKPIKDELDSISKKYTLLEQEITSTLSAASSTISKIHQSNIDFSGELKKQKKALSSLESRDVDLSLSMQRDVYPIWVNFFAVFISIAGSVGVSVWVTREVLTKTLRSESQTQITALETNLKAQIDLQKDSNKQSHQQSREQIASQVTQHLAQLKTQSDLALNEHKEHHRLSIEKFRQFWINDFRDNLTEYVKVVLTLCHFHRTEKAFFNAYSDISEAQSKLFDFKDKYDFETINRKTSAERLEHRDSKASDKLYILLQNNMNKTVERFEAYKNQLIKLQILKTECLVTHTKLSLMFKPDIAFEEADFEVRNGLNKINKLTSAKKEGRLQDHDIEKIEE